jgi:ABC-2 type transport system permease protein
MTVIETPTAVRVPARRMSLWRLEWLRLTRTPRAIALAAVFLFIGLIEPVVTRYERDLIGHLSHGAPISLPSPTPADGLNSYVTEITFIGLIVVVAIAAGALTFDMRPGISTFLRTRVSSMTRLVLPRFALTAAASAAAYLLGTLGAWYETSVLLGSLPVGGMLAGILCGAAYMMFAVAVTTLAASLARSTIGVIGIALTILILLPIASSIHVISNWLPSALVNAPVDLVSWQHLSHFGPALAVTAGASLAALAIAVRRLGTRQT